MSYERLTAHSAKGLKLREGKKYIELLADKELTKKALSRLAELEDKIENGVLAELPYKIGTLVYVIHTNWETGELDVRMTNVVGYEIMRGELWAKTSIPYRKCYIEIENVFLTKAEAEEKLRELRGEK